MSFPDEVIRLVTLLFPSVSPFDGPLLSSGFGLRKLRSPFPVMNWRCRLRSKYRNQQPAISTKRAFQNKQKRNRKKKDEHGGNGLNPIFTGHARLMKHGIRANPEIPISGLHPKKYLPERFRMQPPPSSNRIHPTNDPCIASQFLAPLAERETKKDRAKPCVFDAR